jgi:hypothetical protein
LVRLQKRFAYKYKDKEHYKHIVTITDDAVNRLGWRPGDELEEIVQGDRLILASANDSHKLHSASIKKSNNIRR